MNKSDVADTLRREIEYRKLLISQCESGILKAFDTHEKVKQYVHDNNAYIWEAQWIADKLHVKLT